MIIRFTASNLVGMILFIPILIALALILAFIVPIIALLVAVTGMLFTATYIAAKIRLTRKQKIQAGKVTEVRNYRIR